MEIGNKLLNKTISSKYPRRKSGLIDIQIICYVFGRIRKPFHPRKLRGPALSVQLNSTSVEKNASTHTQTQVCNKTLNSSSSAGTNKIIHINTDSSIRFRMYMAWHGSIFVAPQIIYPPNTSHTYWRMYILFLQTPKQPSSPPPHPAEIKTQQKTRNTHALTRSPQRRYFEWRSHAEPIKK